MNNKLLNNLPANYTVYGVETDHISKDMIIGKPYSNCPYCRSNHKVQVVQVPAYSMYNGAIVHFKRLLSYCKYYDSFYESSVQALKNELVMRDVYKANVILRDLKVTKGNDTMNTNETLPCNENSANKTSLLESTQEAIALLKNHGGDVGELSDGYHTFNELYHHRALLFASLCMTTFKNNAWKSLLHDDSKNNPMYPGMFIVGVETPFGQATYHYDIDPYWSIFKVKEVDHAPKFDGHTPAEAIDRLYKYAMKIANEPITRIDETSIFATPCSRQVLDAEMLSYSDNSNDLTTCNGAGGGTLNT